MIAYSDPPRTGGRSIRVFSIVAGLDLANGQKQGSNEGLNGISEKRMSKQSREVRSGDVIFLLLFKAPNCQPTGPLGSVVLGQNMDISGRLDGTGCSA
jgi:hypothetical protein